MQIDYGGGYLSAPFHLQASQAREGLTLARAWAAERITQLAPRATHHEEELLALGRKYGLVSPVSSLIVLETLAQWVRHEIEPPESLPELRNQYFAALKNRRADGPDATARHRERLATLWKQRVDWWKRDFEKDPLSVPAKRDLNGLDLLPVPLEVTRRVEGPTGSGSEATVPDIHHAVPEPSGMFTWASRRASMPPSAAPASPSSLKIEIKPWDPDTPYLKTIRAAPAKEHYSAYLQERKSWAQSPAFYLDCAEEFFRHKEYALGLRILSNLAELKMEDAALLRVYAWRLRQAQELDRAIGLLRRVAALRPEEPQSFRDLALALAERGRSKQNSADLEEAMNLFLKVAFTPWNRPGETLAIFALEELNALVAWIRQQDWSGGRQPRIPEYDRQFQENLAVDLRIVLSWDADATDVDLYVVEPQGEVAYYGRNLTRRGGLVSRDVTDGYGPEEHMIRKAPAGRYLIKAHYYGSRQQTIVGPATVAATVFTRWGQKDEKRRMMTLRLDTPHEMVAVGEVTITTRSAPGGPSGGDWAQLRPGMTRKEVAALVGQPGRREKSVWFYEGESRTIRVEFTPAGRLVRVVEVLPGDLENILVQ